MCRRVPIFLRPHREHQHLTQTQLARLVGCTPAFISQVEHQRHMPSVPLLVRFATVLETTVEALLTCPTCGQGGPEMPLC